MPAITGTVYGDLDTPVGGRIVRAYRRDTGALIGEAVSLTGTDGDPEIGKVTLLLHADGVSGETAIIDHSPLRQTVTQSGGSLGFGANLDTNRKKFGVSSMAFRRIQYDYFSVPHHSTLSLGSGDFTLEFWVNLYNLETSAGHGLITKGWPMVGSGYGEWLFYKDGSNNLVFYASSANSSWDIASNVVILPAASVALHTWHHLAVTRSGTTLRTFGNGILQSTWTSSASFAANTNPIYIGGTPYTSSNTSMQGWIDEVRITKGLARYTASFTPPTAAFQHRAFPALGSYEILTPYSGAVDVVCLDDETGVTYDDLIARVNVA